MSNKHGMNWITKQKRLAIYLRDGLCCAYCGDSVTDGITLTLDHLLPRSQGGNNEAVNLITCCSKCNSVRGDRELGEFISSVASYINHGITGVMIRNHILTCTRRDLKEFKVMAKDIIALQPNWKKMLQDVL